LGRKRGWKATAPEFAPKAMMANLVSERISTRGLIPIYTINESPPSPIPLPEGRKTKRIFKERNAFYWYKLDIS
jgi:hypothetical protein